MDIRLKTRVEGVHIWLPVDEAIKFLKKPAAIQREVETFLRVGGIDPETGDALDLDFSVSLGRRPGLEAIDKPEKQRKYPPKKKTSTKKYKKQKKVDCPHCDRIIAEGTLPRHIKAAHPEVAASADAAYQSEWEEPSD
jgi:hypothetical protein